MTWVLPMDGSIAKSVNLYQEKIMTNHIDDNLEENEEQDPMESPLAKEFDQHCQSIGKQISEKLAIARQALKDATDLADQHGVPFHAGISPLRNSYVPKNFPGKSKFAKLDQEVICEIAGVYGEYITDMFDSSYGGWLHSAVC